MLAASLVIITPDAALAAPAGPKVTSGPVVRDKDGMVVASNGDAARVGADILAAGGNAVDAAIAMQFAISVSEPGHSGIGGGGFMVVYEAEANEITIIDSRERAPASASPDMFLKNGDPIPFATRRRLGVAVGVPGALAGVEVALAAFGTFSLAAVIEPSIALADDGVIVTRLLADSIVAHAAVLADDPAASAVFLPGGRPLEAGDLLVQPDLADTFRRLAIDGVDAFYHGELGEAFVAAVQAAGGGMTMADLGRYEVTFDDPVHGFYGDYELISAAPPSSGGLTVLQILEILERFDLDRYPVGTAAHYHLLLKAMHLAFADRGAYLGDPEFVDIPLTSWLSPDYIDDRAALIDLDDNTCPIAPGQLPGARPLAPAEAAFDLDSQTTHFNVADRWGNLVAFTTSIEQVFGTGRMLPGHGYLLNNTLTDFDPRPGRPNSVAADKRPMSNMSPTMVFRGKAPVLMLGSPSGPRIIAAVAQVLLNVLERDLDVEAAVELPRVYGSSCARDVRWEPGLPAAVRKKLRTLGHEFGPAPLEVGAVNLLAIDGDSFTGVGDPRRDGLAVGLTWPDAR